MIMCSSERNDRKKQGILKGMPKQSPSLRGRIIFN